MPGDAPQPMPAGRTSQPRITPGSQAAFQKLKAETRMRLKRSLAAAGGLATLLLFPIIHVALILAILAIHLVVLGMQLFTSRLPRLRPARDTPRGDEPWISIHVPAHNEPPEILIQTLRSLRQLDWQHFEVVVIGNNTTEEAIWVSA